MAGSVYFVQAGESGPIKIGWTRGRPEHRLGALQVDSTEPLRLLKTIDGGRADEQRWHEDFKHLRLRGEWFRPEADLLARIDAAVPGGTVDPEAKTEVIQVRLYGWEKEAWKRMAKEEGVTVATMLRRRLGLPDGIAPPSAPSRKNHTPTGQPPSDEATRLADVAKRIDVAAGIHREKLEQVDLPQLVTKLKGQGMTTPVATREARKRLGL